MDHMHVLIASGVVTAIVGWLGRDRLKTWTTQIFKGIRISRDVLDLVDDLLVAVEPDADGKVNITEEEVKAFEDKANKLRNDLQGIKGVSKK